MNTSIQSRWAPVASSTAQPRLATALGAALWSSLSLALDVGAAVLVTTAPTGVAALGLLGLTAALLLGPRALRAPTGPPALTAFASGASRAHTLLAPAHFLIVGSLVAVLVGALVSGGDDALAGHVVHHLGGAVVIALGVLGGCVLFPGAWFLSGRADHPARGIWPALLLVGVLVAFGGTFLLDAALREQMHALGVLPAAIEATAALAALSIVATLLARALFPRPARAVAIAPDGGMAVIARVGGAAVVDADGAARRLDAGRRVAALSRDGRVAAVDGYDGALRVLDWRDGRPAVRLRGAPADLQAAAFDASATRVAAIGRGASVILWSIDAPTEPRALPLPRALACAVAFTPDGRTLRVLWVTGAVSSIDIATGKRIDGEPPRDLPTAAGTIRRAAMTPDGGAIALVTGSADDLRLTVHDVVGTQLHRRWGAGGSDAITALAFGATGDTLVHATERGEVIASDAATGAQIGRWTQPRGVITAVGASAGAERVLAATGWGVATLTNADAAR